MNAGAVSYYLPERGESINDARRLLGVWAKEECETLDEVAELIAQYENAVDPQSDDVTVTVMRDGCAVTFEVQAERVLVFRAVELPE